MKRIAFIGIELFVAILALQAQAPEGVVAVDLGLPSGTKWANMNLDALHSTQSGNRYAFGELEPKASYTKNNYLGYSGTAFNPWASYLSQISGSPYDAAHVKWGGKWRMPTVDEWSELINYCNKENVSQGKKFTGPNGASITIPFTTKGYWTSTAERNDPLNNGGYVYYRGSSYYYYLSRSWSSMHTGSWPEGYYIRPVLNESNSVSDVPMIEMHEDIDYTPIDTSKVVVKLTKTLHPGWNTIVLPFTPGIQLSNVLYDSFQLYQFKGYENGVFNFSTVTSVNNISANTPYLMFYSGQEGQVTKFFSHHNYKGSGGYDLTIKQGSTAVKYDKYSFTGTYENLNLEKRNISPNDYILEGRLFRRVEEDDTLRGFSAYMKVDTSDGFDDSSPIRISIDGVLLDPLVQLDEIATDLPTNELNVGVQVNKTFTAGEWSTICLPFDMSGEQVKSAFGEKVELAEFVQWTISKDEEHGDTIVNMVFDKNVSALNCGRPYLIKPSEDITSFILNKVTINTNNYPVVELPDVEERNLAIFFGTYAVQPIWHSLYLKEGQLTMSDDEEECLVNAFSGYFNVYYEYGRISESIRYKMSFVDNTTTENLSVTKGIWPNDEYYNLQGQRVETPSKGLFIKSGKKILIK